MRALHRLLIASVSAAIVAATAASAAATTNYSDQWWVAAESGWAASVQHQSTTLFVELMVYAMDGKPTWFVSTAAFQPGAAGHDVFSGDLYATTGPFYGSGMFDPSSVTLRKAGTLTFDASSPDRARITYVADGMQVVKNVKRYTLARENLSGTYYGGWNATKSSCEYPTNNGHFDETLSITVTDDGNGVVNMTLQFPNQDSVSLRGTYQQQGRLGRIKGEVTDGGWGYITVTDIERTGAGFTARFAGELLTAHYHDWCGLDDGRIGGVHH